MFDVITFGSATLDILLIPESKETKRVVSNKAICFNLGEKISLKKIYLTTGGGGTNSAATFANQGFKVAYFGSIGEDFAGKIIKEDLKKRKISLDFLFKTKKALSNLSVILPSEGERTIFVWRGASEFLPKFSLKKLEAKWFYIAPLGKKLFSFFEKILKFAKENKIKIAINPSKEQLIFFRKKLEKIFSTLDVVIMNQEEASLATQLPPTKEKEIIQIFKNWVKGIGIITKGPLGGIVLEKKYVYEFEALRVKKVIDRTGCGDAFGSGFVAGILKGFSIENCIQLALANSAGCLMEIGAKNGLLKKNDSIFKFGRAKIKKYDY
jgi:ribokinase